MLTQININGSKLNAPERRQKAQEVAQEIHRVINSTLFRDKVARMETYGETSKYAGLPNNEIYQMLMKGAEEWNNIVDNEWDVYVDDYFTRRGVIGYMYPGKKWIYVNTKFFDVRSNMMVGSNIVHEYSHTLGFRHDHARTLRRSKSVSYQLNLIYEECHRRLIGQSTSLVRVKVGGWWRWSRYQWQRR